MRLILILCNKSCAFSPADEIYNILINNYII